MIFGFQSKRKILLLSSYFDILLNTLSIPCCHTKPRTVPEPLPLFTGSSHSVLAPAAAGCAMGRDGASALSSGHWRPACASCARRAVTSSGSQAAPTVWRRPVTQHWRPVLQLLWHSAGEGARHHLTSLPGSRDALGTNIPTPTFSCHSLSHKFF